MPAALRWRRGTAPYVVDVVLTLFVAVTLPFIEQEPAGEMPLWMGYVCVAAGGAALLVRHRSPAPALLLASAAVGGYLALEFPYGSVFVFMVLPIYAVARHLPLARAAALGLVSVALLCVHLFTNPAATTGALGVAIAATWVAVPLTFGAARRMVVAAHERERATVERQLVDAERLRVAQEVHDVVGHGLAAIQMQADIALHVAAQRPEQARAALEAISLTSGQALGELREALQRALPDRRSGGNRAPTPGLALAGQLCERVADAGVHVDLDVRGTAHPLPSGADVAAYRLLQESLTNVVKHSAHPRAVVTITHKPNAVTLEVTNQDLAIGPPVAGLGIEGMRRRVAAVGGDVTAGPGEQPGTFAVRATIPRRPEEFA